MAITNRLENFQMEINENFLSKAEELTPILFCKEKTPVYLVEIIKGKRDYEIAVRQDASILSSLVLKKGESVCLDFDGHQVGYISFMIKSVGSPPDAPAHLRIKFGEHICEIAEESSSYKGSISSSWIQEEFLHVDTLSERIEMPRRYAFRYIEIKVLDTSPKYDIVIKELRCNAVSSADRKGVFGLENVDSVSKTLDDISLKTLEDCMQSVFEDGPKRDRRLWLGDLRLQALVNYETFKNYNLVKRCLYLFAGATQNGGRVGACIFTEPKITVDDTSLFDYSLFFVSCLFDYYQATKDKDTLEELWETTYRQIELSSTEIDERGVVRDKDTWWCFIDWHEKLNKQAAAQAIFIYTLKQAYELAVILKDEKKKEEIAGLLLKAESGAKKHLWDEQKGFFISGKDCQVSWASQIWFVLADIMSKEENVKLLMRLIEENPDINMVTPYMYHYFIEALIHCEMLEIAKQYIEYYWGGMLKAGADCFWELFDPENIYVSPYGSRIINSYCHAWSCTPSYFIRKYFI